MLNLKKVIAGATLTACLAAPIGAVAQVDLRSPDARDASRSAQIGVDLRSPDARDAGRPVVRTFEPVRLVADERGDGFQWGDAGIGAAGMLALFLAGASLAMRRGSVPTRRGA